VLEEFLASAVKVDDVGTRGLVEVKMFGFVGAHPGPGCGKLAMLIFISLLSFSLSPTLIYVYI
jgi:hypothetical protein